MDELEHLRQQKLRELQEQASEEQQARQHFTAAEEAVKQLLTKEALERYGNIKAAYPDRAARIVNVLAQLVSSGRIRRQLSDAEFRELLQRITPKKSDIRIRHV